MSSQSPIKLRLADKLRDKNRRRRFFLRAAQDRIAMEIRSLRERRGFASQTAFAKHMKMQQSAISRIENADYQGWGFKTLVRVADELDAQLIITFRPAEEAIREFERGERNAEKRHDGHTAVMVIHGEETAGSEVALKGTSFAVPQVAIDLGELSSGLLITKPVSSSSSVTSLGN